MSSPARHAVVMAGGSGTRFWPRSRRRVPKQLLAIVGEHSMLRETLDRVRPLVGLEHVTIVTGDVHAGAVRRVASDVPRRNVLVEPAARNTAAAVALAALHLARRDPRAVMVVLPADHAIGDRRAFLACVRGAMRVAERAGALVTLGVVPTRPETGYGYIRATRRLAGTRGSAFEVDRFIEKPTKARAQRLLRGGHVFWNSGMFAWRVDVILAALAEHVPEVLRPLERAIGRGRAALAAAYRRLPAVSVDVGVLERADNVAMVPARFAWNDVGSWAAVESLWRRPGASNAVRGSAVLLDSRRCIVDGGRRLVAVLGVDDLVVVDADDAVLVCPKNRAQEVRRIVDDLERRGWTEYL